MSNTVGHNLLQQSLLRPVVLEHQSKLHSSGTHPYSLYRPGSVTNSAAQIGKSFLSKKFYGNSLNKQKARLTTGTGGQVKIVPQAVLAMDPASEVILTKIINLIGFEFSKIQGKHVFFFSLIISVSQ